ncbi:methyltransferase [Sulfitobacter sp. SK012]|uniref:DUF938 domain-containing protein n=1 Tax=Sulfitobacter sp. SK012 TaxID=1389005 RepID=UPI000E0B18FF|nr:DUF938 domain-containing protein [Sulfitobacter sp. SK012]AXI47828.1 methyltransferase [Sulfitobacter sp. SK012]
MTRLPPSASVTTPQDGAKLHAPSAERNAGFLSTLLQEVAPVKGRAMEIASGTGQHIVRFARTVPQLHWHPTEVEPTRVASIDAHAAEAGLQNLAPTRHLDATTAGWGAKDGPFDLIVLINLLHLIPNPAATTLINEVAQALSLNGLFVLYGPFKRGGTLTSEGDARFDAELRAADPTIGYKDDDWILSHLTGAGLTVDTPREMPANNLAFLARSPH